MVIGLDILNQMWFTDYRAWRCEHDSVLYELYSEYNKRVGEGV